MAGNTNHYSLPYPTAGDPMYQGAAQLQAAMEGVDAALWTAGIPAVAQTNPPRCQAARQTVQSIPNTTDTLVTFPVKKYDSEAVRVPAAPMFVAGNNFITIRVAGLYLVTSQIYKASAGGVWNHRILYNGSTFNETLVTEALAGTEIDSMLMTQVQLGVGDTLRVMMWQNSGGATNIGPGGLAAYYTRFSATYLGAFSA